MLGVIASRLAYGHPLRALERRPEAGDGCLGRPEAPPRSGPGFGAHADPQGVGLERQPKALVAAEELTPAAAGGHGHREARLDRLAGARLQHQAAGAVAGDRPYGDAARTP